MAARPGVVASGHPRVCDAAADVLRAGGNAFDAAVAAGFAAAVAEPMFTSLGGGGFLLARSCEGRSTVFDFMSDAPGRGLDGKQLEPHFEPVTVHFPASDQVFNIGLGSVAVPGSLAGFLHVHRKLGSLPLSDITAPAVTLAREGIVLSEHQAYVIGLLEPINTLTPEGSALYAPDGRSPLAGERLVNPDLAGFIEDLAHGAEDSLYSGELARRIALDMRRGGGLLTEADLSAYRVLEREPLAFGYRGLRVLTNPPPSFGGSLIAVLLRLLEALSGDPPAFGTPEQLARLGAAMQEAGALHGHTPPVTDPLPDALVAACAGRARRATGGTTHVSVGDARGNAASMTLSNGEGSGYVAPGAGIMLNNMLGEDDLHPDGFHASPPGLRVASMMSPSLVLRDDEVALILGSGGSKRIRTAIPQVLCAFADHGMRVAEAVEAPRAGLRPRGLGGARALLAGQPLARTKPLLRRRARGRHPARRGRRRFAPWRCRPRRPLTPLRPRCPVACSPGHTRFRASDDPPMRRGHERRRAGGRGCSRVERIRVTTAGTPPPARPSCVSVTSWS
jgi:gamma-glutamyltranspeptidase/glutathione hydrolase